MGRALVGEIAKEPRAELVAAITSPKSKSIGRPLAGVPLGADMRAALDMCDVLIDFSHPQAAIDAALLMHAAKCRAFVTGTTGYEWAEERALEKASQSIALVKSGNFSLGICVLEALVETATQTLAEDWDIDILDIHHRFKKDAPSGTALMLGAAAKRGRNGRADIKYASLRHGGVIGEHAVHIGSTLETLTLSHTAIDRAVFAKGALTAALWAVNQPKGAYTMRDVLGL